MTTDSNGAYDVPPEDWRRTSLPWAITQRISALLGLVALLPVFVVVFALVKLTSPGPFLFAQSRRGLGGRPFRIYKIRTMRRNAEKSTALGVQAGDPTVTRVGRILRELKIDELPQLWNIARGDMDLVGPRPIPIKLEDELRRHIPDFTERGCVKPGLTNVSQVSILENQLGDQLIRDWSLRFEGELHYIRNKSLAYDVVVLVMTALYVLRKALRRDARAAREGPINAATLPVTMVAGVPIANQNYDEVIERIDGWIRERSHRYICICPVHSVVEANWKPSHRASIMNADLNTADGMPVVWAQRLFGYQKASRVYGPTLMLKALDAAQAREWTVAFYGGHPDRLPVLLENLREQFPILRMGPAIAPPFRPLTDEEQEAHLAELRAADPDIIWVGLGCPKQERWMHEHSPKLRGVMVGVGAAFDFHAGAVRQAPPSLQRFGLEWAFRLYCEPRRLFRRYATTNPTYIGLIFLQICRGIGRRRRYQRRVEVGRPRAVSPAPAVAREAA